MCVCVCVPRVCTCCVYVRGARRAASRLLKWKAFSLVTKWGRSPALITALLHPPLHSLLSSLPSPLPSPSLSSLSAAVSYCLSISVHLSSRIVFSLSHTSPPPSLLSFPFLPPSISSTLFLPLHSISPQAPLSLHLASIFPPLLCFTIFSLSSPLTLLSNVSAHAVCITAASNKPIPCCLHAMRVIRCFCSVVWWWYTLTINSQIIVFMHCFMFEYESKFQKDISHLSRLFLLKAQTQLVLTPFWNFCLKLRSWEINSQTGPIKDELVWVSYMGTKHISMGRVKIET